MHRASHRPSCSPTSLPRGSQSSYRPSSTVCIRRRKKKRNLYVRITCTYSHCARRTDSSSVQQPVCMCVCVCIHYASGIKTSLAPQREARGKNRCCLAAKYPRDSFLSRFRFSRQARGNHGGNYSLYTRKYIVTASPRRANRDFRPTRRCLRRNSARRPLVHTKVSSLTFSNFDSSICGSCITRAS